MKPKPLWIVIAVTILAVLCITILRAFFPLNGIFAFLEAKWGQPIIIGLQAGVGAAVGVLVWHLYGRKHDKD